MPETNGHAALIIFDLDGTLVDSEADLAEAVNAALRSCGRSVLPLAQIGAYIGDGAATLIRRSLEATGGVDEVLAADALAYFLQFYREHLLDHTRVYPGVLESLQKIREHAPHLPMAVLTNKPVGPSRRICDALGITPYLFANYGGDSFATKKPNPEGLLYLIAEAATKFLKVTARQTVLVGDSDVDVRTARAAGTRSIGCEYGYARSAMLAARPDRVVRHACDLPDALRVLI